MATNNSWNNSVTNANVLFNGGTFNVGTDATTNDINIGTNTNTGRILFIGNQIGTTQTNIETGSGGLLMTTANAGNATVSVDGAFTVATSTGDVSINAAGVINIGNQATSQNINIGTAGTRTITLGTTDSTSRTVVACGTGGASFGASLNSHTTTLGSYIGTSSTNIASGSGGINITAQGSGALTVNSVTGAVNISNNPNTTTVNIATGAAAKTLTLGSTNTTSRTAIQAGSGGIALTGTVTSANAIGITYGNMTINSGNLLLPNTTNTPTGQIQFNSTRFIHNYGTNNTFVGSSAGNTTLTTGAGNADEDVGVGTSSLASLTTGRRNAALGHNAATALSTGSFNTAIGWSALTAATADTRACAVGYGSLQSLNGTTDGNTGCGFGSGFGITNTSYSTCLGYQTGTNAIGASCILIGANQNGVAAEANTLRIGSGAGTGTGQLNKAFIYGIRGITTGVNDAVAVLVDSAGQLGTVSSSARYKENIQNLTSSRVLELQPVSFQYKQNGHHSIGLIAEQVADIMPELAVKDAQGWPETVKYHELPVLLLVEIKKLRAELDALKKQNEHKYDN